MLLVTAIAIFPGLMVFAALSDLVSMTISNKVSLALVAAFAAAAVLVGLPLETLGLHLLAGALVLFVTFACFAFGWMGGGDAKLMAATALWFGWTPDLLSYLLVSALIGGVLTLGLVFTRVLVAPVTGIAFVDRLLEPKTGIPYGIALGLAGLIVFPGSFWGLLAL